jgi:hypothetical protein
MILNGRRGEPRRYGKALWKIVASGRKLVLVDSLDKRTEGGALWKIVASGCKLVLVDSLDKRTEGGASRAATARHCGRLLPLDASWY